VVNDKIKEKKNKWVSYGERGETERERGVGRISHKIMIEKYQGKRAVRKTGFKCEVNIRLSDK